MDKSSEKVDYWLSDININQSVSFMSMVSCGQLSKI